MLERSDLAENALAALHDEAYDRAFDRRDLTAQGCPAEIVPMEVTKAVKDKAGKMIAAICAAPTALASHRQTVVIIRL